MSSMAVGLSEKMGALTWVQVDLSAIEHNARQLTALARERSAQLMAVIKSDAYGHGLEAVAKILDDQDVPYFAVSNIHEGRRLREMGIKKPILLFESTLASQAEAIVDEQLIPTLSTYELAEALNEYAIRRNTLVDVHINIDTGMNRLGIFPGELPSFLERLLPFTQLRLQGLYTHLPSADTDPILTEAQFCQLAQCRRILMELNIDIPLVHAGNSAGSFFETNACTLIRPGLMIYGMYPHEQFKAKIDLRPALSVHSKVIQIKTIEEGSGVSYGQTFIAPQKMTIAVIPIGYNNGYPRALSNKGSFLINGELCPVLGRVTMDQIIVDVSRASRVQLETPVVILGPQGRSCITADQIASQAQTISYEILCGLGSRLPRIYTS